jgi:16S rRNA (cytosine1402-N4)-methyltransferase
MVEAHIPVLLDAVITTLAPKPGHRLLDATVGHGGHARVYLDKTSPNGLVVGLDADNRALEFAQERLKPFADRFIGINANFANLKDSIIGGGILEGEPLLFHHILFDLGVGSHQLADPYRGFSFRSEGPLSMLYGTPAVLPPAQVDCLNHLEHRLNRLPDALDLIQSLEAEDLATVIYTYGEEKYSRRIAQVLKKDFSPALSAQTVAEKITEVVPASYRRMKIHPATRTFQALRIAVNRELESLSAALPQALDLLLPNGILAVISFHSLEDRIVKHFFQRESRNCLCPPQVPECVCHHQAQVEILTKKPVMATAKENSVNPRARSAKLRAVRKLESP